LQERLSELARTWLKPEDYIPLTVAEAELTLDEIESDWVEQLAALEPYGMGNPTPLFIIQDARLSRLQLVGAQQNHLKLQLQAGERTLDAVGFRLGELAHEIAPQAELKVLGELQMNEWNGRRTPQLIVRDLAVPHLQVFDWRSNRFHHDGWAEQIGADAVCFRSQASSRFGLLPRASWRTVFWEEIEGNEWVSRAKGSRVAVVADPPPSLDALVRGLNACADTAERLYFLFGDAELDDVLVRMPTRDEFKRLYQVLKGKNGISLHKHLSSLMRVTGLQKRALSFMIQVFEELGFLEVRQGEIHLHPEPRKRALTESKRYQSELDRQQVLHTLVYSSYKELCHFLFSTIAFKHMGGNLYELQREDPRDSRLPAAGDSL
jgi:single-stranded-DNA-specific exonuclease